MPLAIFILLSLASGLKAEGTIASASLSAPFENTASSARTAGMGGALYFSDGDSSLVIQNPAALSALTQPQVSLHHNNWIADILQEVIVLGLPIGDPKAQSSLGVTANYVNYGHFQGRDEAGRPTTALGASDLGLGVSYGRRMAGPVAGGIGLKATQQTLADRSYTTYSADFGIFIRPSPSLSFSAAYAGLGSSIGGSQRATVIRLGASAGTQLGDDAGFRFGLGVNLRPQGSNQFNLGTEFEISRRFSLRAGYSLPLQTLEIDGLKNIAFGAGFRAEPLKVDYAYLPYGELGNVQRISIAYSFGNQPAAAAAPLTKAAAAALAPPPPLPLHAPLPPPMPALAFNPPPSPSPSPTPQPESGLEFVVKVADKDLILARDLESRGSHREAIEAYSRAIQRSPEDSVPWKELGDLYFRLGKRDYAQRCYDEVLKMKAEKSKD